MRRIDRKRWLSKGMGMNKKKKNHNDQCWGKKKVALDYNTNYKISTHKLMLI